MPKTFGTKEAGSLEPETQMVEDASAESGILRVAFFVMAGIAVLLFAYNMFFAKTPEVIAAEPATIAVTPTLRSDSQAPAQKFPDLDVYLEAAHVNPNKSRLNRFSRTSSLLEQCGPKYAAVSRDYSRKNQDAYLALKPSAASSTELNAQTVSLGLQVKQDNSALASVKNAETLKKVQADRAFSRSLSARECSYVSQRVRAGDLNI